MGIGKDMKKLEKPEEKNKSRGDNSKVLANSMCLGVTFYNMQLEVNPKN